MATSQCEHGRMTKSFKKEPNTEAEQSKTPYEKLWTQKGIMTPQHKTRRRTFPLSEIFCKHPSRSSLSIVSSTLDFLYLGRTDLSQNDRGIPASTFQAAKSIMKRWNDFRAYTGHSFVGEFESYIRPVSHKQVSHPEEARSRQHDNDVSQFARELYHKGLLRGEYKLLEATRLDLLTKAPPPDAFPWLKLLPETAQVILGPESISNFIDSNFHMRDQTAHHLEAQVHCTHPGEYPHVLECLSRSQMLEWSLVRAEESRYSVVADFLTMTSFAVVKDDEKDRFISWPRIQNSQFFELPVTK